ncbi:isoprenyl transferase [Ilyobacter polytropus]|uniref:Isoprenyl transferase n=1 Tax=Ilyobacter polytropus (strain ATCC 51220 / DSM 2926 / LMG 16218 / CuHBu1) TaxID=572544 RepID=E3H8Z1_ILYPC|nr:isoprenyl transferase [Ilyobacter polytropus]ADO83545.1 Undecaprenyl pyrophosphate synthetase [Ilyobacter polytropus DSM 2926]
MSGSEKKIPKHIAIIMDGNGRWAKKRGLPRTMGHRAGAKTLKKILTHAGELGVKYLTVYAFSTENWKRPQNEVDTLMKLFKEYLKNEKKTMMKNGVRLMVSGKKEGVNKELIEEIEKTEKLTEGNDKITLNIAFNYGGRSEIVDAVNKILKDGVTEVTEESFSKYMYRDIPDPELLIRTSGEIRISNFLLWQIAYTELYITELTWPDFDESELEKALNTYMKRDRRFGGLKNEK